MSRPAIVAAATRMNISPAEQATLTELIIKESGGDMRKVKTAYAVAARARKTVSEVIAKDIRSSWIPPTTATLHWDGKQIATLTDVNKREERMPILVGSSSEVKLLAVAKYQTGTDEATGDIIAAKVFEQLFAWECVGNIASLCFDTTASNTGHLTAACVSIQSKLQRALLWCACRHHVGEVILTTIFEDLKIEVSKSPEYSIFQRFKKNWDKIDQTSNRSTIDLDIFSNEQQAFIKECIVDVSSTLEHSEKRYKMRGDYKEMLLLCQHFLQLTEKSPKFMRPGAMHKARWMAKIIYAIKMCLLEDQIELLPKGTIATTKQMSLMKDFVIFISLLYSRWWFLCQSASHAPWYDLCFYKNLIKYSKINKTVSAAAVKAFNRHLWYLTPELVVLALFGKDVPSNEKEALGDALKNIKPDVLPDRPTNRHGMEFGKPIFPAPPTLATTLADLVSADSWWTVNLLRLDMDFLSQPSDQWQSLDSYITCKNIVDKLNVVNDPAERAVKMTSDFINAARDEDQFQNVLQVVESDRKKKPNLRRKTTI